MFTSTRRAVVIGLIASGASLIGLGGAGVLSMSPAFASSSCPGGAVAASSPTGVSVPVTGVSTTRAPAPTTIGTANAPNSGTGSSVRAKSSTPRLLKSLARAVTAPDGSTGTPVTSPPIAPQGGTPPTGTSASSASPAISSDAPLGGLTFGTIGTLVNSGAPIEPQAVTPTTGTSVNSGTPVGVQSLPSGTETTLVPLVSTVASLGSSGLVS